MDAIFHDIDGIGLMDGDVDILGKDFFDDEDEDLEHHQQERGKGLGLQQTFSMLHLRAHLPQYELQQQLQQQDEPNKLVSQSSSLSNYSNDSNTSSEDDSFASPVNLKKVDSFLIAPSIFDLDNIPNKLIDQSMFSFDDTKVKTVAGLMKSSMVPSPTILTKKGPATSAAAQASKNKRARARTESLLDPSMSTSQDTTNSKNSRGAWTKEEDDMLRTFIAERSEPISWTLIAQKIKTRTGKQCRERWTLNLDPSIDHSPFRPEEDEILMKAHSLHGSKWAKIKFLLPGRTENSIKTRYKSLMRRANGNASSSTL